MHVLSCLCALELCILIIVLTSLVAIEPIKLFFSAFNLSCIRRSQLAQEVPHE
jgi:hypothetical protein